ncbi:YncE family protein [Gemmatimonadota bacterium]
MRLKKRPSLRNPVLLASTLLILALFISACDENPTEPGGNTTPGTLELVAEIAVGSEPLGIVVAGDYYVVGNYMTVTGGNNTLMVIDPATMTVIDSTIFPGNPEDLIWAAAASRLYVSNDANRRVKAYSLPDLTEQSETILQGVGDPDWYGYPAGLIYDSGNGGRLWGLEEFSGYATLFSAATGAIIDTVRYRPFRGYGGGFSFATGVSVAFDAGRSRLYAGNIDDSRLEVISTISMSKVDSLVWDSPEFDVNFVFSDPVNGHILVNERSSSFYKGKMVVYDADDLSLYREVEIPEYPDYGGIAWVTEGARLVMATGGTLTEYSTPAYTRLTKTDLPTNPARVAYDPVRGYYVITFIYEDMVRVYQVPN